MRAFTLSVVTMLSWSAVASADPPGVDVVVPPPPTTTLDVGVVMLGGLDGSTLAFETFVPVAPHLNVHGLFGVGEIAPMLPEAFGPPAGTMAETYSTSQLRGGLEGRRCTESKHLCGIAGLDLGVLSSLPGASASVVELSLIPRIGIETGGRAVRFRFVVEESAGLTYQGGRRETGLQNLMIGPGLSLPL
jgi:hypothetical protein